MDTCFAMSESLMSEIKLCESRKKRKYIQSKKVLNNYQSLNIIDKIHIIPTNQHPFLV